MKLFVCLAAFALLSVAFADTHLSDEEKEKLKAHHKECQKETNVDIEVVKKVRHGEFADDPKLKAQLLCVAKKIKFQDETGKLNVDRIKESLTKHGVADIDDLVKDCLKDAATPEETAWAVAKCWHDHKVHIH